MLSKGIGLISLIVGILAFIGDKLISFETFRTSITLVNIVILTIRPFLFIIGIICFIPPLILLICYVKSGINSKEFDESPFYKSLLVIVHITILIISLYILAWTWVVLIIVISLIFIPETSIIISSLIIIATVYLIDFLIKKKFKFRYYQIFRWLKLKRTLPNQPQPSIPIQS